MHPHDWDKLKKTCSGWRKLSEAEQKRIEGLRDTFHAKFISEKKNPEAFFEEHGIPKDARGNKGDDHDGVNRQRAQLFDCKPSSTFDDEGKDAVVSHTNTSSFFFS